MSTPTTWALTSSELATKSSLSTAARKALDDLTDLIAEANSSAANYQHQISTAITAYNIHLANLFTFANAVAAITRRQFNSITGPFADSPEGAAVADFISEWEAFLQPIQFDLVFPDPIDPPDDGDLNQFSSLPTEP